MGTNKKHFSIIKTMVIVQKCVFSGSELISDAFDAEDCFDGRVFKCKSEMVNKEAMKFDIGDSDDVDDQDQSVNDIVDGFDYTGMNMKKGEFQAYIKKFMGKVKTYLEENNKERVEPFMTGAKQCVGHLLKKFDDLEFYLTRDDECMEGHIAIGCWDDPEADTAPTFYYFKDALYGEKY